MKSKKEKVYFETLGCQMNKSDSDAVAGMFLSAGFELADSTDTADIILLNTCSVREKAEDKALSRLGTYNGLKKNRTGLTVVLMGCMAQRICVREKGGGVSVPQLLSNYGVDVVVGTGMFDRVPALVEQARHSGEPVVAFDARFVEYPVDRSLYRPSQLQAWVTIMRGCDNYCSYCIVPYARGHEYSRKIADVVDEVRRVVNDGAREVTLLGQNVNSYAGARGGSKVSFTELLSEVAAVPGLLRLRFVTNHPKDFDESLVRLMAETPNICPYLHVPAQSGSTRMLKLMNRKYTREHYLDRIRMARDIIPDIEFASDFIVGFPSETDEDFEQTISLMEEVRYLNCFVFRYSPRPGTKASGMADDVPQNVKAERNMRALDLQRRVSEEKNTAMVGQTLEILVEGVSKRDKRRQTGRSRWNQIVVFESEKDRTGELVNVKINSATHLTLYGEVV